MFRQADNQYRYRYGGSHEPLGFRLRLARQEAQQGKGQQLANHKMTDVRYLLPYDLSIQKPMHGLPSYFSVETRIRTRTNIYR